MGCFWWLLLPEGLFGWLLERWPFYLGQQGKPQRLMIKKSNYLSPVCLLIHRKMNIRRRESSYCNLQELMIDPELSNASYLLGDSRSPSSVSSSFRKHSYSSSIARGGNCVCWTLCRHCFIPFSQLPSQAHLVSLSLKMVDHSSCGRWSMVWCSLGFVGSHTIIIGWSSPEIPSVLFCWTGRKTI